MKKISVRSPAKINLFLAITGKRKDGYHNLATLFQMVSLYDRMTFTPNKQARVRVTCSQKGIKEKENLAYRAAMMLWKPGMKGVDIHIEKEIPSGGGLGGGSSNAATTLLVLNRLWQIGLTKKELQTKARKLGADIPFFLESPRAWATGIGDRLTPLPACEKLFILLVKPSVNIPTPAVYRAFSEGLTTRLRIVKIPPNLKGLISVEDTVRLLRNDLENTVKTMHPVVGKLIRKLSGLHSKGVMVTGSGATVFAVFDNREHAGSALRVIRDQGYWSRLVEPLDNMRHLKNAL